MLTTNHDKAGCAEATLAPIHLCQAFLHWMGTIRVANAFDGDDMFAIDAHYRSKTCIDRGVIYLICRRIML